MRLSRLLLAPYGSHTNTELVLGKEGTLDVVYGPNEAGKSTLRRSIVGLLYGIEERTPDAHKWKGPELRITADVLIAGGMRTVTRKKGRKATLTDETGAAFDEAAWARALGGTSREAYERGWGLDHELLRKGAEAMLSGDADLGESLLSASTGAVNLGKFRASLRERADELYSDKARKKPLNDALLGYAEKKKCVQGLVTNSEVYLGQKRALAEAEAERASADARRAELVVERQRAERQIALGRLFAQRRVVLGRLADLGDVPRVTEESARARANATETLAEAGVSLATLDATERALVSEVETSAAERAAHAPLLHLDQGEFLTQRGAVSMDRAEHARKTAELAAAHESIAALLARLPGDRPQLSGADLTAIALRLRELGQEAERLSFQAEQERVQLARIDAELLEAGSSAEGARSQAARTALSVALAAAEEVLERTREVPRLQKESAALRESLATLPEVPSGAVLPDTSALEALAAQREPEVRAKLDVERELARLRERSAQLDTELSALAAAFALPSEAELALARGARDALLSPAPLPEGRVGALREAIAHADGIADRMRRESERIAQRARLAAERDAGATQSKVAHEALERLDRSLAALEVRHAALFVGMNAPDVASAQTFVRDAARSISTRAKLGSVEAVIRALTEEEARCARALATALGTEPGPLRALTATARDEKAAAETAERVLTERTEQQARRRREHAERTASFAALTASKAEAARRLEELSRSLSLPAGASPELAEGKASALAKIAELEDEARVLATATGELAARVGELDTATERLFAALGLPPEADGGRRAQVLADRLKDLARAQRSLEQAETRLAETRARKAELVLRVDAAQRTLEAARAHLGAKSYDELPALEQRARERAALEADVLAYDLRIGEQGGDPGAPIEEGEHEAALSRLPAIEEELSVVEARLHKALGDIGGLRGGIANLERAETGSLTAQAEAEAELARITDLSTRWARLVLTGMLLDERIAMHRAENESDVLAHASELVAKITGGSIKALRPSYEDEEHPVLVCVRPDGSETHVAGLSDGAKDALYLALRIASLTRLARGGRALPVLLDDVLIHMDDDRAKVAVAALGELASETQVLFFTHHKRMVELCEAALPKAKLKVSTLG